VHRCSPGESTGQAGDLLGSRGGRLVRRDVQLEVEKHWWRYIAGAVGQIVFSSVCTAPPPVELVET
jgi:hypothetical protein